MEALSDTIDTKYEMWAESQVNNYWAWIISALFILFVITGFVIRSKKEKD